MNSSFFCDTTPCSPLKVNQCFVGALRLHFQGKRSQEGKQGENRCQGEVFLLDSFLDLEDGDMLLRNVG
jgi:hypothetical protein